MSNVQLEAHHVALRDLSPTASSVCRSKGAGCIKSLEKFGLGVGDNDTFVVDAAIEQVKVGIKIGQCLKSGKPFLPRISRGH